MNLFEAVAILLILVGIVVGVVSAFRGNSGLLMGALKGAAGGFGIYLLMMFSILIALWVGLWYRPPFPKCKNGKCSARKYRYLSLDTESENCAELLAKHPTGMLARCQCGTLYLRAKLERRIWEVAADGSLIPYMRYRPFGRWQRHTK